ncbi:MAG: BdhA protein [Osedax symbiont Rs2]|nr:MAG: BdhA protein [Osedax symbiont Rs2]
MNSLQTKHVIITGGGTGVGSAIASAFAEAGAKVTISGRTAQPLQQLAAQLPNTIAICCDVTDRQSVERMLEQARTEHGPVDIAIANAGAVDSMPFSKISADQWQQSLDVNLTGTFNLFQATMAQMQQLGWGRLIAIASTAALKGYPYVSHYCAAKHAVVGLVRSLALECASKGLTANALCPGFIETPMLDRSIEKIMQKTSMDRSQARAVLNKDNPMGRFIQPAEVADSALFLCTDGAASINGQSIAINGGEA